MLTGEEIDKLYIKKCELVTCFTGDVSMLDQGKAA